MNVQAGASDILGCDASDLFFNSSFTQNSLQTTFLALEHSLQDQALASILETRSAGVQMIRVSGDWLRHLNFRGARPRW
jgi:hypothetical protein